MLDKIKEGCLCRSIAADLGVSKTQIQGIVWNKKSIREQWETRDRAEWKYSKVRKLCYEDLDRVVCEWFTLAWVKNIPISGCMIQERALMYAEQLGHNLFSGSNGCLDEATQCLIGVPFRRSGRCEPHRCTWLIGAKDCCQFLKGMT